MDMTAQTRVTKSRVLKQAGWFTGVIVSGLLLTGNLWADETEKQNFSSVELGALYVTKDSFKFGEYTGLEEKGTRAIANIEVRRRNAHDSSTARYLNLQGFNLGLTSREAYGEYGSQGNYKIWAGYDELPQFQTESARTIFSGAGTTNLTLPSGWVAAPTTAGLTSLSGSLQNLKIDRERRRSSLGFSKILLPGWAWDAEYSREAQEGRKITGGVMGWSGGNPRAVLIPEPIDYITNQFTTRVRYTTSRTQVQARYTFSLFDNHNSSLTWANPYAQIDTSLIPQNAWADAATYANGGRGSIAPPPDNRFHKFGLTLGHNLSNATRITAHLSRGRMTQNAAFLPYTVNSGLTVTTPLPRSSLKGRMDNTLLLFKVTARPFSRFHGLAQYRYDDRNNHTPRAQYLAIGGGSQDQPTTNNTDKARTNLPFSFKQNQVKLEGGYTLPAHLRLRGSYTFDHIVRTFTEVRQTRENTFRAELKRNPVNIFGSGLYAVFAKRKGSSYHGTVPYLESHSPEYTSAQASDVRFSNNPALRRFSYAHRDRKQLGVWVSCMPRESLSLQLDTNFKKDDYRRSVLGLKESKGYQATLEAAYTPTKWIASHAFYTHEFLNSKRNGRSFGSGNGLDKAAQSQDASRNGSHLQRDSINTVGAGVEFTALKDKYDMGVEYLYSLFRGKNAVAASGMNGTNPTALPLPLLITRLHSLELYGTYKIKADLKAKLSYWHERLYSRDWAYDNVTPGTLEGVILTAEKSQQYAVNVFGLSLNYDF